MIYQHVNNRAKILPLATFHIAHLCKQFNQVCITIFYATFQKHYFLIKIALKLSYFGKKIAKIFKRWGLRPQTPVPPAAGGFTPRPPKQPLQ